MRLIITKTAPGTVVMELQRLMRLPGSSGEQWVTIQAREYSGGNGYGQALGQAQWNVQEFER